MQADTTETVDEETGSLQHELSLGKGFKSIDPEWLADHKELIESMLATNDTPKLEQVGRKGC